MLKQFLIFSCLLALTSCADKNDDLDSVIEAQECLDKYARTGAGDLNACEAKVGSSTSPAAYGIRCSAGFIREGITATSLINAFSAIDTMSAANMATFLSLISFDVAGAGAGGVATNLTNADTVFGYCASSLAKGASIIASFSYITNALMKHSCDNNGTPFLTFTGSCAATATDVGGALASIAAGGASTWTAGTNPVSIIGTVVIRARQISCLQGSANETLCEFYNRAVTNAGGTSNATLVGQAFVNALLTP